MITTRPCKSGGPLLVAALVASALRRTTTLAGILTDQELRFLLESGPIGVGAEDEAAEPVDSASGPAFSGDLENTDLRNVLQTLSQSGVEGVLVVASALEEHYLWIRSGRVRDWVPSRVESRRIGRRLVRAGLVTAEQVEAAAANRADGEPLGQVLVREGLVTLEQIEETARSQALEDIYSIFVWTEGTFDFHEGPPSDTQRQSLEPMHEFAASEILEEVERREPEWGPVLERIGSLDEILTARAGAESVDLEDSHRIVLDALDGTTSLVDLSKSTMLSLFDCARAVKQLCDRGLVSIAPPEDLLDLARAKLADGERQRAVVLLTTLTRRKGLEDPELVRGAADLLAACKENRTAAEFLLSRAMSSEFMEERLELARAAHRLSPRSSKVLSFLRDRLLESAADEEELRTVSCDLADALVDSGWNEEALDVIAALSTTDAAESGVVQRRVRILCKLERPEEAVWELTELASLCKEQDKSDHLARVYEQILRIDGTRDDIAAELKGLRRSKRGKLQIWLPVGAVLLVVGVGGFVWYRDAAETEALRDWVSLVRQKIVSGDPDGALQLLESGADYSGSQEAVSLKQQIDEQLSVRKREAEDKFTARLNDASDLLQNGDLPGAIAVYRELRSQPANAKRVDKVIETRLGSAVEVLEELAVALPEAIPEPPDSLDTAQRIESVLGELAGTFRDEDVVLARSVVSLDDPEALASLLGEDRSDKMITSARTVIGAFERAAAVREKYEAANARAGLRRSLADLWTAAQQHEKNLDIAKAHEIYEKLAREYPAGKDGLREVFANKRDRYGAVVRDIRQLEELTRTGDLNGATRCLASLKNREPEIPFDDFVSLPVRVESSPPGATVFVSGQDVGKTPLLTAYRAAGEPEVRVELEGFQPVLHTIRRKMGLLIRVVLVRAPAWTAMAKGVAERRAAFDDAGVAYVVDRSGRLTAMRGSTGEQLWSESTGDLSGLLPTPTLWRDRLLVSSLDGPVRCYARGNGKLLWERDGYACESAGVAIGDELVLATTEGRLVMLGMADGELLGSVKLPGEVQCDLQAHEKKVLLTTANGWLVCVNVPRRKIEWRTRVGDEVESAPVIVGGVVAAGSTDGRLLAVRLGTGEKVWDRFGLGDLRHDPVAAGSGLIIVNEDRLVRFEAANGAQGGEYVGVERWIVDPTSAGGHVLVGDKRGMVAVVDANTMELLYHIKGDAPVVGPVSVGPDGCLLAAFEDRSIRAFTR